MSYTDTDCREIDLTNDLGEFWDAELSDEQPLPGWLHQMAIEMTGPSKVYGYEWTLHLTIEVRGDRGCWGTHADEAVQGWEKHELAECELIGSPPDLDYHPRVRRSLDAGQRATIARIYDI